MGQESERGSAGSSDLGSLMRSQSVGGFLGHMSAAWAGGLNGKGGSSWLPVHLPSCPGAFPGTAPWGSPLLACPRSLPSLLHCLLFLRSESPRPVHPHGARNEAPLEGVSELSGGIPEALQWLKGLGSVSSDNGLLVFNLMT